MRFCFAPATKGARPWLAVCSPPALRSTRVIATAPCRWGYAAQSGQTALVDLPLEQGAPINARNLAGSTALYAAAENDRGAVVRQLPASSADPNLAGRSGVTALAAAAFKGHKPVVDQLLENGSRPNAIGAAGKSPISHAAALGLAPIVQRLLDAGVKVNSDSDDLTVPMWAAGYADGAGVLDAENVVKLPLDRDADINATDDAAAPHC
jgi:uncharacterized protein